MRKSCVILLLLCCLLLSGCMSSQVEEQLLVIAMGLDREQNGGLTLTVKVPGNAAGGQSAPSGNGQENDPKGYLTLHATGHHFSDTLELLLATTPRSLNFSQVWEVVISRDLAGEDSFSQLLMQLSALPRMHTQAAVVICEGKALSFVQEQKPYVGVRLSRYIEVTLRNYTQKGFVPSTTLARAVRETGWGWQDPLLILGGVSQDEKAIANENVLDVAAGQLPADSPNKARFYGAAATDGIRVSGTLTGYETALINLLRGSTQSLILTDAQGFPLTLYAAAPARLSIGGEASLTLHVHLRCQAGFPSGRLPDESRLTDYLEEEITKVIRKLQSLRCDALGFGSLAVRRFCTVKEWEAFHFRDKYTKAQVVTKVQLQLKEE